MIFIDMEMPQNCNECPCSYFTEGAYTDYCEVTGKDLEEEKDKFGLSTGKYPKPNWCPLKEEKENTGNERRIRRNFCRDCIHFSSKEKIEVTTEVISVVNEFGYCYKNDFETESHDCCTDYEIKGETE